MTQNCHSIRRASTLVPDSCCAGLEEKKCRSTRIHDDGAFLVRPGNHPGPQGTAAGPPAVPVPARASHHANLGLISAPLLLISAILIELEL